MRCGAPHHVRLPEISVVANAMLRATANGLRTHGPGTKPGAGAFGRKCHETA